MFVRSVLVAALAVALAAPVAAQAPAFVPLLPAPGAVARYHISFDGHFWNGQKRAFEHDLALERGTADAVTSTATGPDLNAPDAGKGSLSADGRVMAGDGRNRFASFNAVAAMIAGAPAEPKPGDTWKSRMPVDASDTQSVEIPVTVKVASASGGQMLLQATGSAADTMTYAGFTMPIELSVRAAASFADRAFARADFAVEETVHAGPQTQNLGWQWSLTPR